MPVESRRAFKTVRTVWHLLPEIVRVSPPARALKRVFRITGADRAGTPPVVPDSQPSPGPASPTPRVIETLAELDEELRQLDAAAAISDDALRRGFESFVMRYPGVEPPARAHGPRIGHRLGQHRHCARADGPLGHALDIEANFVALVAERSRRKRLAIETIQGDFSLVGQMDRVFDAVIFFESCHQASNHQALVASLDRIVAPDGQIAFAGSAPSPFSVATGQQGLGSCGG